MHYEEALSETVLSTAFQAYANLARQYESVITILECLQEDEVDESEYERGLLEFGTAIATTSADHSERAYSYADSMLETGEVMPWSEMPFDVERYVELVALPAKRAGDYSKYMEILEELKKDRKLWAQFGANYVEEFTQAVECDASVTGKYYKILIAPETDAMKESSLQDEKEQYHQYSAAAADYPKQNEITKEYSDDSLEQYQANQDEAWLKLHLNAAVNLSEEKMKEEKTEK